MDKFINLSSYVNELSSLQLFSCQHMNSNLPIPLILRILNIYKKFEYALSSRICLRFWLNRNREQSHDLPNQRKCAHRSLELVDKIKKLCLLFAEKPASAAYKCIKFIQSKLCIDVTTGMEIMTF